MQFDQLGRREFIGLLGGLAAWPLTVRFYRVQTCACRSKRYCVLVQRRAFAVLLRLVLAFALGPVAAYLVRALALECRNAQAVPLLAVVALPAIESQCALAIDPIPLLELGGGLGGL